MIFFDRRGVAGGGFSERAKVQSGFCAFAKVSRRPLMAAFSGLLLLCATACQDPIRQAESYALQAQALADAGDNKGALDAIQRAVALRDDNASYFLLLGSFRLRANDTVAAYNAFKRALELDAANVTALNFVANLGLQTGQVDEAEKAADKLLTLQPRSIVALQVKGMGALFRNKLEQADGYADKILAISPSDEAGSLIRARTLVKAGKPEEALALIDKTMLVSGRTSALLITKLNTYRIMRQPQQMAAVFDELMPTLGTQVPALRLDQINLLYKMGQTAKARAAAFALLEAGSNDPQDYQALLRIWFEYDPMPFDKAAINRAGRLTDSLAAIAVGRFLIWQKQYEPMSDFYFHVRPGIRPLLTSLRARSQRGRNAPEGGQRTLGLVLDSDKDDVDAQIMLAQSEQGAGQIGAAMEAAQKAVSSDPNNPETYIVLAGVNRQTKDNLRARQVFEDGLRQLPQSFLLIENYTQFLHDLGDRTRAISVARSFARTMPSSVKAWGIYAAQCRWANDATCLAEAEKGQLDAQTTYKLDDPPGTPTNRGLLSQF